MSDILGLINNRHSVREFDGRPVEREALNKILEAGRLSPSARNTQPWKLYCAASSDFVAYTAQAIMVTGKNMFCADAGAFIAITEEPLPDGVTMARRYAEYDIGMCIMQMCLEAESLGVGSCILGTYSEEAVKCALDIPFDRTVSMVIAFGYSAEKSTRQKNRKSFEDSVVIR